MSRPSRSRSRVAPTSMKRRPSRCGSGRSRPRGAGDAEQVFLRGFDAREGQDLEFTVDGVPINDAGNLHGNGYADTHFILPELVRSLRVTEGAYAPQQGNFAVAGSADYQLGLGRR